MATAKAERLLNLVIALVNSPRYRTVSWIRDKVAGYADATSEEAFFRMFERDKQELRDLGIPLQTPPGTDDGYRIAAVDFALPQLSFTPAEAAALALAGRLWETTVLGEAGTGALRKIRDAAGPASQDAGSPITTADLEVPAADLLQPRVRTSDPAFTPLYAAVRAGRAVSFAYRKEVGGPAEPRAVEPWGLVSFRGRWYVIGRDRDRGERRTFRLSRIVGAVKTVGRAGAVQPPPGIDLLAEVAASVERPAARSGTVRIRSGRAAGLRRSATAQRGAGDPTLPAGTAAPGGVAPGGTRSVGASGSAAPGGVAPGEDEWDVVDIPVGHLWDTARMIAAHGPDVVVLSPPDLADAVVRLLSGLVAPDVTPGASGGGSHE